MTQPNTDTRQIEIEAAMERARRLRSDTIAEMTREIWDALRRSAAWVGVVKA